MSDKTVLRYPVFDGVQVWENASVVIEDSVISQETVLGAGEVDSGYFLAPGLIDAHAHMGTNVHVSAMLRNGITSVCDVSAPASLIADSDALTIHSSAGMAMGLVLNGAGYVEKAAKAGAKYIKVLLFDFNTISKKALQAIVDAAHGKQLKVAVHATAVATVQLAVECGADILIHVPMKEKYPQALAERIARNGIAVAPTLVMMETFANSGRNGYRQADYANAEDAVRLLHACGAEILCATDANPGDFAPEVAYGASMHRELELLVKAGLSPIEALRSATNRNALAFDMPVSGIIAPGQRADLVLVKGRPDQQITDSSKIVQVWAGGKPIL